LNRFLVILVLIGFAACGGGSDTTTLADNTGGITTLQVEDLVVGTGATAATGDTLNVNYIGTLRTARCSTAGPTSSASVRARSSPAGTRGSWA
jgi:hypothetical protein